MNPIYPLPLKPGDRICIIDPANAFREEGLKAAVKYFEEKSLEVVVSDDMAFRRGTVVERAEKLNRIIRDPKNRGIFCFVGGYGSMTLLDDIDYEALKENRPVFTGFSDITAMHLAIAKKTGLVTLHSPSLSNVGQTSKNVKQPTSKEALDLYMDMMMKPKDRRVLENFNQEKIEVINPGNFEGQMIGGNMSLVVSLMGTSYEADTKGKIIFLEEVGEKPYRLHRMLMQLKMSGKLSEAAGVVIGALTNCDNEGSPGSGLAMVKEVLQEVGVPAICNVRSGHISDSLTIPIGCMAKVETKPEVKFQVFI